MPFYSCGRLGASKERPLECSGIGGIAPRGFSAASASLSFFCAWRCGLCGKSWSLRFPARLLRSSKQDPRRGLPARRGSLGVTSDGGSDRSIRSGRYNVALSRSLVAPATCQSAEARARCDQAREPRRIAVTDGRSLFLIGRGTPRYHHDAEGEQYPKPDRRSNQQACVHFAPSRCSAQRELCNLIVLGLRGLVCARPTNENPLHRRPPLASVGPWLFRTTGRNRV